MLCFECKGIEDINTSNKGEYTMIKNYGLNENGYKYRFIHQFEVSTRKKGMFELGETTQAERQAIAEFLQKVPESEKWLEIYSRSQYQVPYQDGQVNREYMVYRANSLLSKTEMKRSFSK